MWRRLILPMVLVFTMVSTACLGSDSETGDAPDSSEGTTAAASSTTNGAPSAGAEAPDESVVETTIVDEAADETSGESAVGTTDACELVTAVDAERILGAAASIDPDSIGGFGETSACSWVTDADALLFVSLFEGTQFYGGSLPDSEELSFGDDGHITVEPNFGGTELQVVDGDWVLSLSAAPFGVVDAEGLADAMLAVAEQALDRLP